MKFKFEKVFITDYAISRLQSNVEKAFNLIQIFPLMDGNFIEATIGVGDTVVDHKLGRPFQGWVVVNKDANSDIWQSATVNNSKDISVILKATVEVNAKIYIF